MRPTGTDGFIDRMTALLLLRHGPTEWTEARRLQGRSDVPLSDAGRRMVAAWRLPDEARAYASVTSPLKRSMETADILLRANQIGGTLRIEPRLVEMSFGDWEGYSLTQLRAANGPTMEEWEAQGLDLRPPNGESPREVQNRLQPWLEEVVADSRAVLAVTHKGVIRALYSLATGWDMRGKPVHRLAEYALHRFELGGKGPRIVEPNIRLCAHAAAEPAP